MTVDRRTYLKSTPLSRIDFEKMTWMMRFSFTRNRCFCRSFLDTTTSVEEHLASFADELLVLSLDLATHLSARVSSPSR